MHKAALGPHRPTLQSVHLRRYWDLLTVDEALISLDQKDVTPCADDVICILQKCRITKNLQHAKRLHAHIHRLGLEGQGAIGNHMVPTFVECGSVSDAQEVFGRLVHRNVHAWTSLMLGYVECGNWQHALDLYQKMQEDKVQPSTHTLVAALRACTELNDVLHGQFIHGEIVQLGWEGDLFVGSSLVNMYAACGLLGEAEETCYKCAVRNVVTWNALIAGYCTPASSQKALNCLDRMQAEGIVPSTVTYACVLKACGSIAVKDKGQEVHTEVALKGLESNIFVGSGLVDMYAKFGCTMEATEVFNRLPAKNIVSWNALMAGYVEHGPCEEALKCFERIHLEDAFPNASTYACALKACASIQAIEKGQEIHAKAVQNGFTGDIMVGTSLVDMYSKSGLLLDAKEAFDELPVKGIVAWNALITGYAEHGPGQRALACFEQMQREKVHPNSITYACILKACGSLGALDMARNVHLQVLKKGHDTNIFVSSSLVGMYVKCGSISEASNIFNRMAVRNAISWNSMIKAFGVNQDGNMAVKYFEDMQEQGIMPDARTFVCLLLACSRSKMFFKGQEFLKLMRERFGIAPSSEHLTCMVDLFARSGFLFEAEKFLESLPGSPSRDMLTAFLTSCGIHEEGELGLKCFRQLLEINSKQAAPYVLMAKTFAT